MEYAHSIRALLKCSQEIQNADSLIMVVLKIFIANSAEEQLIFELKIRRSHYILQSTGEVEASKYLGNVEKEIDKSQNITPANKIDLKDQLSIQWANLTEWDKCERSLNYIIEQKKLVYDSLDPSFIKPLSALSTALQQKGEMKKALAAHDQLQLILEHSPGIPPALHAQVNRGLGEFYLLNENFRDASVYLAKSLVKTTPIQSKIQIHFMLSQSTRMVGDYEGSIVHLDSAKKLLDQYDGMLDMKMKHYQLNLLKGIALVSIDPKDALIYLNRAHGLVHTLEEKDLIYLYANLGWCHLMLSQYDSAGLHILKCVKLVETLDIDDINRITPLKMLEGRWYFMTGDYRHSLKAYERLEAMMKKEAVESQSKLFEALVWKSLAHRFNGELEASTHCLEQAEATMINQGVSLPNMFRLALLKSTNAYLSGHNDMAIEKSLEALRYGHKLLANTSSTLTTMDRINYTQNLATPLSILTDRFRQNPNQDKNIADSIFKYSLKVQGLLIHPKSEISSLTQEESSELSFLTSELNRCYELRESGFKISDSRISGLEFKIRELERLTITDSLNVDSFDNYELDSMLKEKEALVHISRHRNIRITGSNSLIKSDSSTYFVTIHVKGKTKAEVHFTIDGKKLESSFKDNYTSWIEQDQTVFSNARASYNHFWRAIDTSLQDIQHIYLISDGIYSVINPETFPINDTNFIFDKYKISRISNLSQISQQLKIKNIWKDQEAFLVGNPRFLTTSASENRAIGNVHPSESVPAELLKIKLSDLPGTQKEVTAIDGILKSRGVNVTLLTEELADESLVKSISSPSIVHFATHGFYIESVDSGEVEINGLSNKLSTTLFQTGLFFANAQNTLNGDWNPNQGENGILTANEIKHLQLRNTDLVVLSACETGLGVIVNGQGVWGLQSAFLQAGAESVIMSLWPVEDNATKLLMTKFYQYWTEGISKPEALRMAKRYLINLPAYNHPMYWGGFVLIGS
jgi:CHAT domain-containing protein